MVDVLKGGIAAGNRTQAIRNQSAVMNDLGFLMQNIPVKKRDLVALFDMQKGRVRKLITLYKANATLPEYELFPKINTDLVIVKVRIEDVLSVFSRKELRGYFEKARGGYNIISVLMMQVRIINALDDLTGKAGSGGENATVTMQELFIKLESWLEVEEILINPWSHLS